MYNHNKFIKSAQDLSLEEQEKIAIEEVEDQIFNAAPITFDIIREWFRGKSRYYVDDKAIDDISRATVKFLVNNRRASFNTKDKYYLFDNEKAINYFEECLTEHKSSFNLFSKPGSGKELSLFLINELNKPNLFGLIMKHMDTRYIPIDDEILSALLSKNAKEVALLYLVEKWTKGGFVVGESGNLVDGVFTEFMLDTWIKEFPDFVKNNYMLLLKKRIEHRDEMGRINNDKIIFSFQRNKLLDFYRRTFDKQKFEEILSL